MQENSSPSTNQAHTQPQPQLQKELERLAALSPVEYERQRKQAAAQYRVRLKVLDAEVESLRCKKTPDFDIPPVPWDAVVDGADLLTEVSEAIRRHVAIAEHESDAIALWIVFSHAVDSVNFAPRLFIRSAEKRSGKSTLLEVMSYLVFRPLPSSNITPSSLFRRIEDSRPTLLIDEADTFVAQSDPLIGILNSGHTRRFAKVDRMDSRSGTLKTFSTFAAIAIAAIGNLPGTIEDRSIVIGIRRKKRDDHVVPVAAEIGHLDNIARRIARWAKDNPLGAAPPESPPAQLNDRAKNNWEPLFAVASAAGGNWPVRAREAAMSVNRRSNLTPDRRPILTPLSGGF